MSFFTQLAIGLAVAFIIKKYEDDKKPAAAMSERPVVLTRTVYQDQPVFQPQDVIQAVAGDVADPGSLTNPNSAADDGMVQLVPIVPFYGTDLVGYDDGVSGGL